MATPKMVDISGLPAEILANILDFIRTDADMAAVSLVSRKWRDAMAKDMWAVKTTSFQSSFAKDFTTLMEPQSGLLSYVRSLCLENMEKNKEADERLKAVVAAVPQNKLRSFDCDTDIPVSTLRILLQRQQSLSRLDVLDVAELVKAEEDDWIGPAMASITDFAMTAPRMYLTDMKEKKEHYQICRRVINNLPRLKIFRVKDDEQSHAEATTVDIQDLFRGDDGDLKLPPLIELAFDGIYISPSTLFILENIDLSTLKILYLYNCTGIADFLQGLSQLYSKQSGPLSRVSIDLGWTVHGPSETKEAIQTFLSKCPNLTWLLVDVIQHLTVGTECIERHADTLQFLYLNMGEWPKVTMHYDLETLHHLMKACKNITTLSINIPPADLGLIAGLAEDFSLGPGRFDQAYVASRFESYLAILASHPSLQSLRLLDPPSIEFSGEAGIPGDNSDTEAKWCRVTMQNFADQVLRFTSARGSLIKLLVTQPATLPRRRPAKDRNSHQWPVYTYTKGCMTDTRGVKTVVAAPLDKIRVEMVEQESMMWN